MLRIRHVIGWSILALLIVWPLALWGADREVQEPKTPIARLDVQPARVDWLPQVDYQSLILTVTGPRNLYIQREFSAGETPFFSSLNETEGSLPNGSYAYELRVVQRPPLGDERFINEQQKVQGSSTRNLVQSGHFWLEGGSFIDKIPIPPDVRSGSTPPPSSVSTKIVQGRTCIGAGCAAGDDNVPALKLKELFDTRITFENSGCCHPSTRSWALQANDGANATGDFLIRDLTAGTIPFRIGSGGTGVPDNSLTIWYNGNVGLGTLTPAVRLDVKASTTGQAAERLQNTSVTGFSGTEYLDNAGNVDLFFGVDNAASTTRLNSVNNNPIAILTNSVERMRITTDGKFGIGTASPSDRFHFFENIDASTIFTVENPNTGSFAASVLRAKSDSALAGLVAHGSGKTLSRFGQPLGGWAELLQATGNGLIVGTQTDKPLILGTNSANRLHITAGGTVGIGTTAPSSLLHVNGGDVRVSGGSFIDDGVTLNVPDYVFEPDYRLMPLEELRKFVTREKHLPNVPSAGDIKKEGLNLSQLQMRLLEKLEELTLYTLKQDEQIKAQQARIDELQSELKARLKTLEQATAAEPEQQ